MTARSCALLVLALAACGKSRDQAAEPKPGSGSTAPDKPAGRPKPVPRGPERAVYSFVDNRLASHHVRGGGLFLPAGSAGFAKYVTYNNTPKNLRPWQLEQKKDGVRVARTAAKTATLHVPLTAAQAKNGTLRMRVFAGGDGTMAIHANPPITSAAKPPEGSAKLATGWNVAEVAIPAGQLVDGENVVVLTLNAPDIAIEWIQIGGETVPEVWATYDAKADALVLPKDSPMIWYVLVPERARVVGEVGGTGCAVVVTATGDDGTVVVGSVTTGDAVDLDKLAGKPARIELDTAGCASATFAKAGLVVPGEEPKPPARGAPPEHVVFLIMDSLRYDRVRAFNPKARAETPNFDKLAASSAMFHQHYVQGNESQVSHASMWTASYLAKHRCPEWQDNLIDKWQTPDEIAKAAKMFAAAATGNGFIRPSRGYGNGWNQFANHIESGGGLKGGDILDHGLSFITPVKTKPWLMYVGLIDTHVQWYAKKPWIDRYSPNYKGRWIAEFGDEPNGFPTDLTEAEMEHVRALYDSNVSYQDDLLGKLRARLEEWGVWDKTMLVITADHGDEQWEDQKRVGHGTSINDTLVHVPLLIHYPPLFPGKKIAVGTEGVDVLPTIADALGVTPDPEWQGASLLPLTHAPAGYAQLSTATWKENFHAGRLGMWKVRVSGGNPPKVFHIGADPFEGADLFGKHDAAIAARMLIDPTWTMLNYSAEWKKTAWGNPANTTGRFAADRGE